MKPSQRTASLLWILILFSFTFFATLDTFVIEHPYEYVEEPAPSAQTTINAPLQIFFEETASAAPATPTVSEADRDEATASPAATVSAVSTENSYSDANISITIQEIRTCGSNVYVADIVLSSPKHLQTAFANNAYGRNVAAKTSRIANSAGAILAINGDYYGVRSAGYVIRNGVLYRSKPNRDTEDLVIYRDGSFGIVHESQISAHKLLDNGAWNVLSFGPAVLIDGKITMSDLSKAKLSRTRHPRTAIGIIDKLHYLFVVSDGRTKSSMGLTLPELAQIMQDLGATTAYNLDGGGSSTMVFLGKIVNHPTSNGKKISERSVSDIVCIVG